jgi:ABC-type nickel/cobalt efflux system permease component RcnA
VNADFAAILGIGLVLGFRHAFEPDHMAAVTTLAGRQGRLWEAWRLGLGWSIGHSATIALAALVTIALGVRFPSRLWPIAELLVAALLVLLGVAVLVRTWRGRWHVHRHSHDGVPHLHVHSHARGRAHDHVHPRADARWALGFGLMHGLAGSGAVLALLVAATPTPARQWLCLGAFAAGTTAGMIAVSSALWIMVRVAAHRGSGWVTLLRLGSATVSVIVGSAIAWHTLRP